MNHIYLIKIELKTLDDIQKEDIPYKRCSRHIKHGASQNRKNKYGEIDMILIVRASSYFVSRQLTFYIMNGSPFAIVFVSSNIGWAWHWPCGLGTIHIPQVQFWTIQSFFLTLLNQVTTQQAFKLSFTMRNKSVDWNKQLYNVTEYVSHQIGQ